MPTAVILGGPNGAGKTAFASGIFHEQSALFLNADEIGRTLAPNLASAERDLQAGRELLRHLDVAVVQRRDFVVETTLASRLYARRIAGWRACGYRVGLVYLRLPSAQASLDRVRLRALRGGHDVPVANVLRRYGRSVFNLETVYKPLVDEWRVWEAADGTFRLVDRSQP